MMLDRIVEVFCEVDDFCQAFVPQWEASLIGTGGPARRGPEPGLSPSEIITLLLVFHSSGFKFRNCPGSPFAGVNSTCTGRKTMDFQHLNSALAYHYRAKRAYFGQYRDRFSTVACN